MNKSTEKDNFSQTPRSAYISCFPNKKGPMGQIRIRSESCYVQGRRNDFFLGGAHCFSTSEYATLLKKTYQMRGHIGFIMIKHVHN